MNTVGVAPRLKVGHFSPVLPMTKASMRSWRVGCEWQTRPREWGWMIRFSMLSAADSCRLRGSGASSKSNAPLRSGRIFFHEIHKLVLLDGDTLLFCTDGLTNPLSDETIAEVLEHHPDPEDGCTHLVDLALSRGGPDNVTAVVACYQVYK